MFIPGRQLNDYILHNANNEEDDGDSVSNEHYFGETGSELTDSDSWDDPLYYKHKPINNDNDDDPENIHLHNVTENEKETNMDTTSSYQLINLQSNSHALCTVAGCFLGSFLTSLYGYEILCPDPDVERQCNHNGRVVLHQEQFMARISFIIFIIIVLGVFVMYKRYVTVSKKKEMKSNVDRIHRVLESMGSIHSPIPCINDASLESMVTQKATSIDICADLCESVASFIHVIDFGIETLRIATSLRLGLGAASKCVSRVEKAHLFRNMEQTTNISHQHPLETNAALLGVTKEFFFGSFLGLEGPKTSLYQSMREQARVIRSVINDVRTEKFGSSCSPTDNVRVLDDLLWWPESPLLSLSFLKTSRSNLTKLLSILTKEIFESGACHPLHQTLYNANSHTLRLTHFLKGTFPLYHFCADSLEQSRDAPVKQDAFDNFNKELNELASFLKHLEDINARILATFVSSWALTNTMQHQNSKDNKYFNVASLEWWENMRNMLEEAGILFDAYELKIFRDLRRKKSSDDSKEQEPLECVDKEESLDLADATKYEHISEMSLHKEIPQKKSKFNKTMVFAGSGCASTKQFYSEEDNSSVHVNLFENRLNQNVLFEELKSRLKAIELVEEVNICRDSEINCTQTLQNDAKASSTKDDERTKTDTFWLGASGSLLAELKNAISKDTKSKIES